MEGLVGYARRNFMVPIPRFSSWEAFNEGLKKRCLERRGRRLRGHAETIGERFERDRQAFLPLPTAQYEACDKHPTRATSLSLVRYQTNDYSVPTRYVHREVLVKAYVDELVVCCGSEEIARHRRGYEREELWPSVSIEEVSGSRRGYLSPPASAREMPRPELGLPGKPDESYCGAANSAFHACVILSYHPSSVHLLRPLAAWPCHGG